MTGCIIHIEREEALKVDPTCAEAWRSKSGACRLQFEGLHGLLGRAQRKERARGKVSLCHTVGSALGPWELLEWTSMSLKRIWSRLFSPWALTLPLKSREGGPRTMVSWRL